MALAARYTLRRAKSTGNVDVMFEVRDIPDSYTSGGETKTDLGGRWDQMQGQSLWYGRASGQTGPALTWDTTNDVPGADNPTSWENTLTRIDGTSGASTVTVAYNDGVVTVTGLRDVPVSFDASAIKNKDTSVWSRTSGSSYASIICESDSVMELYGIYVAPYIESLTLTGPAAGTMVYWAGYYDTGAQTVTPSSVVLQISRDPNFGTLVESFNVNPELSAGTGEHSTVITGLETETLYYMRLAVSYTGVAVSAEDRLSNVAQLQTQVTLPAPTVSGWLAQDGAGYVSWGAVENAAGYEIAVVDSASADPVSGTSAASPWNFNETNGTAVQDRYVRLKSVAVANQYAYANSEWSAGVLITGTRTPEEEEPSTPVEINMTRRIYKAIPYIDVPVEQIGANGSSPKDVITVEYADEHYVQSGGEIPASQIPFAVYGTTASDSETTVVNPAYVASAIDAINEVYAITDIQIASNDTTKFAGVATSVTSTAEDYTLITRKGVYDFASNASNLSSGTVANALLKKAKSGGGEDNAGIVYISNEQGQNGLGLKIDSSNDGLLSVNFATYSAWSDTTATKVANPAYVKAAIEGYVADATKVTATGGIGKGGMIVKLDANGFIDGSMLKVVSVTNYFEAADQAAMLALSDAQDGDICVRTDEHKTYILMSDGADNGYATASNWKELTAPTGTVTSVNGKAGAAVTLSLTDIYANGSTKVTIDTSISETAIGTENYHFPTSKAVQGYVTGLGYQTASDVSTAISNAVATSVADGVTGYTTGDQVYDFVTGEIEALELGAAAKKGVATSVAAGNTDLVTSAAVYTYVSGLDASDFDAAPASHPHALSDITYSGSGDSRVGYSAGTTISSSSTAGQLATAKAVYDYKPFVNRIIAGTSGTTTFSGVTTNLTTTISSENYSIPTAYAVQQALNGKAASSHNQSITTIYATGTTKFTGTVTAFSGYTVTSEDYQVATAYAIKTALEGKANATHTHTSAEISDAIATVSDPSASSTFGKVVKTESSWGQIGAKLVPIDENSLEFYTSAGTTVIQISDSYVNELITNKGYITATTAANTYARKDAMFPTWTAGTSYAVGDVVWYNNTLWKCHTANTALISVNNSNEPSGNATTEGYTNCWTSVDLNDLFGGAGRYTGTVTGDGSTTSFDVTHNLGVTDVDVTLIDNTSGQEVYAAVTMYSSSVVRIGFGAAPASGKVYRVVVRK